jgi:hypothetical protein
MRNRLFLFFHFNNKVATAGVVCHLSLADSAEWFDSLANKH